jgi:Rieske Fe-S protein
MADERTGIERAGLPTRRRVFTGAGAVGAAALLAACGAEPNHPDNFEVPEAGDRPGDGDQGDGDQGEDGQGEDGQGSDGQGDPEGLVPTADVAVGGGVILAGQDLVVTQPEEGSWRAFSATCTHQGCLVSEIRGDVIYCNCHGSEFSIRDGSVVREASGVAPGAQDGLPPVNVEVDGDWVVRG